VTQHLIFFDDTCAFCLQWVTKIKALDSKRQFSFIPMLSDEARHALSQNWQFLKDAETLVLIENAHLVHKRLWIKGRAVMRIFWLLGSYWKLIGWLAFIPFGIDQVYSFIAKHRHRL
jgi:predicted DCC family thiol-disulfide oxidoreductase YuxK